MTVAELKERLNKYPDKAQVYVLDDNNFVSKVKRVIPTRTTSKKIVDCDETIFEFPKWKESYDEEMVKDYNSKGKITGIAICD